MNSLLTSMNIRILNQLSVNRAKAIGVAFAPAEIAGPNIQDQKSLVAIRSLVRQLGLVFEPEVSDEKLNMLFQQFLRLYGPKADTLARLIEKNGLWIPECYAEQMRTAQTGNVEREEAFNAFVQGYWGLIDTYILSKKQQAKKPCST